MGKQQRTIQLGTTTISYSLEWKAVKNVNLRIRKETGLSVSAPKHVELSQIEAVIRQHEKKILEALAKLDTPEKKRQQYPLTYTTGETVLYLGKWYTLEVARGTKSSVQISGERILLLTQQPEELFRRKSVFDSWWNSTCQRAVQNLCRAVYPIYAAHKISFPEIKFRAMVSQWGNCRPSRGILTFNTRLLAAPVRCMEYVVVHEFTHFLYPNHSKAFYQFIEAELPDWRQLQETLQKMVETRVEG